MDRGGTITWYLDADDRTFTANMRKAEAQSEKTAKSIDRDSVSISRSIATMVSRSKGQWRQFHRNISRSADIFRDWQTVMRGANLNAIILSVTIATAALVEFGGALLASAKTLAIIPAGVAGLVTIFAALKISTAGLGDAFEAVAEGDAENLAEAMAKLGPKAQGLVREFERLNNTFKPIQDGMREAFSANATTALTIITNHIGQFKDELILLGGQLGKSTELYADNIAKSDIMSNSIGLARGIMDIFNGSIGDQIGLFDSLIKVGDDYIIRLAKWTAGLLGTANAFLATEDGQAQLAAGIEQGIGAIKDLGGLAQAAGGFLLELFAISDEAGVSFIGTLTDAINDMTAFLKTPEGRAQIIDFFQVANDTLKTFLQVLGTVAKVILDVISWINDLDQPVKDVVFGFIAWAAVINPLFTYLAAQTVMIAGLARGIGVLFSIVGGKGGVFTVLSGIVKTAFGIIGNVVKNLPGIFTGAFAVIGRIIGAIGPWLLNAGKAIGLFGKAFAAIPGFGWIIAAITTIIGLVAWMISDFEGFKAFWVGLWNNIVSVAQTVGTAISDFFTGLVKAVTDFGTSIGTAVGTFFAPIIQGITQVFTVIWQIISGIVIFIVAILAIVAQFVYENVVLPIVNFFVGLWTTVVQGITDFVALAGATLVTIVTWIGDNIITPIVNFFVGLWTTISEGIATFIAGVIAFFTPLVTWYYENIITPVANFFIGLWNGIVTGVTNAIGMIKSIWNTITGWIQQNIITPIGNFFKGLWDGVVAGVTGMINGIKNTINGIINVVKTPINAIIDAINGMIKGINNVKVPDWVPGLGGKSANIPTIPKLADGGIVMPQNGGVLANIAEAGEPEAVIPLSKLDKFIGTSDNSSKIENHIGTVNIASEVDGENWLKKLTRDDEVTSTGLTASV